MRARVSAVILAACSVASTPELLQRSRQLPGQTEEAVPSLGSCPAGSSCTNESALGASSSCTVNAAASGRAVLLDRLINAQLCRHAEAAHDTLTDD